MSEGMGSGMLLSLAGKAWGWVLAFGLVTLAAGIAVLAWPAETLLVIAVLFGIQLVVTGIFRFVLALTAPVATGGMRAIHAIIGLLSLIVGVWAIRHADLTVLVLAVLLGIYWIVHGTIELFTALSEPTLPDRGWTGVMGALSVVAGIIVVAIPGISVLTLAVVLGVWLVVFGLGQAMVAFRLRSVARAGAAGRPGAVPAQRDAAARDAPAAPDAAAARDPGRP
ncbi:MAG TPA: DUF308 domain-containing protein [Trebonia sp.]|jgi:uncharacterized membrane protein HdeD (DUF308 family)|nr:DUF308 domain-containing protein [Trebonia sp.]